VRSRAALAAVFVLAAAGRVAAGPVAAAEIGRLAHDVVPVSQSIALTVDPRQADYLGSVDVVLDVKKRVRSFRFHAEAIPIASATLSRLGAAEPATPLTAKPVADGQVEVTALAPIAVGRYTLHVDFTNNFDTEAKGLYRLQVKDEWYAFTQFEAIDAREAFPCWDEPAFKIPFQMTLTVPEGDAAISNTLEARSEVKDGMRTVTFHATPPLPSYLLAIATGPLEFTPIPNTSIPARVVTVRGQSGLAGEAVAMTPPLLAALERYFGSRHPYEKLDLVAVPEYWYGAMENPGAITYVDRRLLIDPARVDAEARDGLAVTTAHELAHMWFGDLVTMAWWDDLWLNESFASWLEDKITDEVYPEFRGDVSQVRSAQGAMTTDGLLTTKAIRQPVRSMDSLLQSADDLAYSKGSAVLHMTERWLGTGAFRTGVLAFLKAHADGNATGDDLWNALGKASAKDVKGVLESFLDQPGVPLVSVEPLPGGRARLTQRRFVSAGAVPPKGQLWKIPVKLSYLAGNKVISQQVLLTKAEQIVTLTEAPTSGWIHPNDSERGYYRWSVPPEVFAKMADDAPRLFDARERVGFLGNAAALLSAGLLHGAGYAHVLEAFAADDDPEVIAGVVSGLGTMRNTFFSEGREGELAPFVRRTLQPALAKFGMTPKDGEPESVTLLRPNLLEALGDAGRDEAVLAEMEKLAGGYLKDPSSVDASIAGTVLALSAIRGDAPKFDLYRNAFEKAQVPAERRRFLQALGYFRDPALVDRALDYVFAGPLRPQEVLTIPRVVGTVPSQQAKLFAWMTAHYGELAGRIPDDFLIFMPYFAAGCSAERIADAKTFFADPKHAPPGTATELNRVAEGVGDCVSLDAREGESVRRYTASAH